MTNIFETKVKIQEIIDHQLPEFLVDENPNSLEFFKQYYKSQEFPGGPVDIVDNLDQYIKLDKLIPEVIALNANLLENVNDTDDIIHVSSTKGYPKQYGLIKIDDEIITYTGITTNTFTGCIRGFSGITNFHKVNNPEELVFSTSSASSHDEGSVVTNLSSLFLKEFYKKIKYTYTPGLENIDFSSEINVGSFIKEAKSFYQSKGTPESFKILFRVLYGEEVSVIDLEKYLIKPSSSEYIKRKVVVVEPLLGNPLNLIGQTVTRSDFLESQASVSEVNIINRDNKIYYELSLYDGYDPQNLRKVDFLIHPKTKVTENISIGSSVISVDSTIGFPNSGSLLSGDNLIFYTDKTVNQFLNCSNITSEIKSTDDIRTDQYIFGYEDGDLDKIVKMRITGVLSSLDTSDRIYGLDVNSIFTVKNVGEIIPNNNEDKKQIFANSWIYNTSSTYSTKLISGSEFKLFSLIDKSSLKIGDKVEVFYKDTQNIAHNENIIPYIKGIDFSKNTIELDDLDNFNQSQSYYFDIRRKLNKASSSLVPIKYGNDQIISDIQNVYNENNEYFYVASNGLPSYTINENILQKTIPYATEDYLDNKDSTTNFYTTIKIIDNPFKTGDSILYESSSSDIPGLISGSKYFVQVVSTDRLRFYESRSFIGSENYINLLPLGTGDGSHTFTLDSQSNKKLDSQKLFKKFPINVDPLSKITPKTSGNKSLGMLKNGVEIFNYQSPNKLYYGPLKKISILNSGRNYDVINLPNISVSAPSIGTTALIQPVVSGSVKEVLIDPQNFDIKKVLSVTIDGGNGYGCELEAITNKRYRSAKFDGREISVGGGVDTLYETITFSEEHNFENGQRVVYNSEGNNTGIGIFGGVPPIPGSNLDQERTLVDGSSYYVSVINSKTVQIYERLEDYNSGINTVGFTTTYLKGIHEFRTIPINTLDSINVINSGYNYTNRKLLVKPTGISTINHTVTFPNHNFNDGDLIEYSSTISPISGITTTNQFYILKVNNDTFRIADAGNTKDKDNYNRKKFVEFQSSGSGFNIFKYPDISVNILVSYANSITENIQATPVVRGSIIDAYLYDSGVGYGSSTILNLEKKPFIKIKTGKNASVKPVVIDGSIERVEIDTRGSEYYSIPDLEVIGDGFGCKLRPVIENNTISKVIVLSPGKGYTQEKTRIRVVSSGSAALIDCNIRDLTLDDRYRFNKNYIIENSLENLQYGCLSYDLELANSEFNDNGDNHSPLIGWAYDGNPIYGPYGYENPDTTSEDQSIKLMESGYTIDVNGIENRPSSTDFPYGSFIEDHVFKNVGDLDVYNGRWCKTPDFPNGVYAYFATINSQNNQPSYPYFIGNYFRSELLEENNTLSQNFDFNNSKLIRNTFPYKVGEKYAGNDFIVESNEVITQNIVVESISSGSIETYEILESGSDYKVGDLLVVDNTDTNGGGFSASVSEITGKEIDNINTVVNSYDDVVFSWINSSNVSAFISTSHQIYDNDRITISGLSSYVSNLGGYKSCNLENQSSNLFLGISSGTGIVTDIYVSNIPYNFTIDSTVGIGTENFKILNIFENKILRARREYTGIAHSVSTEVKLISNKLNIPVSTNYFDSRVNDKFYFNPISSVGIGTTTGLTFEVSIQVGNTNKNIYIPTRSIYLPNHPFKNGQEVIFRKPSGTSSLLATKTEGGASFSLPNGDSERFFIIKKSKDYIGLCTNVGLTTNYDGLFFVGNGTNDYEYSIESDFSQIKGKIEKIKTTVTLTTSHTLEKNDIINLTVKPNSVTGIGTSSSITVSLNNLNNKILINQIGFSSVSISTATNEITLLNHNLNTGDKVYYTPPVNQVPVGLQTGIYYIYRVNSDKIQLSETLYDTQESPPEIVNIESSGGSNHSLSLINPKIEAYKNNSIKFDLSNPSLLGYNFKLYYDQNFKKEFVSVETSGNFSTSGIGTVGLSTTASYTLDYSENIPKELFYSLEKDGIPISADTDVKNYSKIFFSESKYNGRYEVSEVGSGLASTTFSFSLRENPIILDYNKTNCDVIEYSTTSVNESGGVSGLNIISTGFKYKKIPKVLSIDSENGKNGNIKLSSSSIGNIGKIKIVNAGYDYSVDNTLRPEASIPQLLTLDKVETITSIEILSGGKNYISAPNLVIVNSLTREEHPFGIIEAEITTSAITNINVIETPYGLSSTKYEIFSVNNTNGITITSVSYSQSGIVSCTLSTPVNDFYIPPFSIGDKIFVEGIENLDEEGTGFNSKDYGYKFFEVFNYINTNPAIVQFDLSNISSNPGIPNVNSSSISNIVNYNNYPKFEVFQQKAKLFTEEFIFVFNTTKNKFVETDLKVYTSDFNNITINGEQLSDIKVGDIIMGVSSGVIAEIISIFENKSQINIDFFTQKENGWQYQTGFLNYPDQVTIDSDYYQNLSYSIKSTKQFDEISGPVNQLTHPIGLKNFSDTQVSAATSFAQNNSLIYQNVIIDCTDETRVDAINNFDLVLDDGVISNYSKFLRLKNKKLNDYIECISNKVLKIDDFSSLFANVDNRKSSTAETKEIDKYTGSYINFLVQIKNPATYEIQLVDLIALSDSQSTYTLERGNVYSTASNVELASLEGKINDAGEKVLEIKPSDPYGPDTDLDIKILKNNFAFSDSGIGTFSVGFVNLSGGISTCGVGSTASIISYNINQTSSIFVSSQIIQSQTGESNFVDLYLTNDGTNTYISEYFFDTNDNDSLSSNYIGSFTSLLNSQVLTLNYKNNSNSDLLIRSKVVGFGSTSIGIGTYTFLSDYQPVGTEDSARYESYFSNSTGITTIFSDDYSRISSLKSLVRVSSGSTSSLYQIIAIHDTNDVYIKQYPILSTGSPSGIGTFGGYLSLTDINIVFYPDPAYSGSYKINCLNQIIYSVCDIYNTPNDLVYGKIKESLSVEFFDSINGDRYDKTSFAANYKKTPIYQKTFNPANSSIVNLSTGEFAIKNHFFSTGERLVYTPKSTFFGISPSSVGIGSTLNSIGVVTSILPKEVYAIKVDNDTFKLSTRYDYALSGIGVTFTSVGSGNAHTLDMYKKLEKTILSIDGVVQSPIKYTNISHKLENNGGQIGIETNSYISLSGISSISAENILKIDDEYVEILDTGFGTSFNGPITGIGTYKLISVKRGSIGSSISTHSDSSNARLYVGNYNIVDNNIHFVKPPRGESKTDLNLGNLPRASSTFNGRVFLRQDYTSNTVYDDISDQFTGISSSVILTIQGISTSGVQNGNNLLFINEIFQTPTTENNSGNNYDIVDESGVSKVVFTGITSLNGQIIVTEDVNQNQLPRNGLIVSLGSSDGLGYAPLVGASVTAVVSGGAITSIGIGTTGNWGSGYNKNIGIISVTDPTGIGATITAIVGAGGSLAFNIINGGSGYSNPTIIVPEPSYENLPVIGVSRLSEGITTSTGYGLLMNVEVGPSYGSTGVGSSYFSVNSFKITRQGYGFKVGDVFKPVGLVTDSRLGSPIKDFTLTVVDTFTDSFSAIEFGELDYIDTIKFLQNGTRTRFPLIYQNNLLSFEAIDPTIDLNSVLVIFIDGIIQDPGVSYNFTGGSSFTFTEAPKEENNVSIFFYRGTRGVDTVIVPVNETLKIGDTVQAIKNDSISDSITQQERTITGINTSDIFETNIYFGLGIETLEPKYKSLKWIKQKSDTNINGEYIYKSRNSLESQVYPTARIIKDVKSSDTSIFVDDIRFFNYEEDESPVIINDFDALLVENIETISAGLTATVSVGGTIQSISIVNPGFGYTGTSVNVKISAPLSISPGIGSVASGIASISNRSLSNPIIITSPGFGYTSSIVPKVIVESPLPNYERIKDIEIVQGFSGIITGISTTTGVYGNPLALKFNLRTDSSKVPDMGAAGISSGYPIYIFDTYVGTGVTSIDSNNSSVIGIGTEFLNNIYYIHNININANTAEIVVNVKSNTNIIGITTSGSVTNPLGKFSWGRITNFKRSTPIGIAVSGFTINSGLSSFPTIQRRGYGENNNGSVRKNLPN